MVVDEAAEVESWGTVEGALESLDRRWECSICSTLTGRRIRVIFDQNMADGIAGLSGQRAVALGRIHYRGYDPVRVDLQEIQPAMEPSDVPLSSLFGRGRSWFGAAPSGELTRTLWVGDP